MYMKRTILAIAVLAAQAVVAQPAAQANKAGFELGSGLNFSFNEEAYTFTLSGMLQPQIGIIAPEGQEATYLLNAKRTYLNFSGTAKEEKLSFFLQLDFSLSNPLLDAYVGYHPFEWLSFYAGQKQNIANNREMLFMENRLQFADRSLLSTAFSNTGREFGLFVESKLGGENFRVVPQISVSSGDGRNSFGADSRDADYGGLKYSVRLDVLPFGDFTTGNDNTTADLAHERRLKAVVGVAGSYNDGASDIVGEGHGNFFLYNGVGDIQLPDYRQLYADVLLKYRGFSLLGEYVVATATGLQGLYINNTVEDALFATQIGEYLALGSGYNAQLGYVTKSGYRVDVRYASLTTEFDNNPNVVLATSTAWTVGFSKYFKGNDLKIMAGLSALSNEQTPQQLAGNVLVQVVF
jgi:hypothetical protein